MSQKHFNLGTVFGLALPDTIEVKDTPNKKYLNMQMNVSGRRCGSVRAFVRVWGAERFEPLLKQIEERPHDRLMFKGFFGQFWDDRNTVYATYTIYHWEVRDSDPRAAFI